MNLANILASFYNNLDGEDIILLAIIFLVQNSKKADQAFLGMLTYVFLKDYSMKRMRGIPKPAAEPLPEARTAPAAAAVPAVPAVPNPQASSSTGRYYSSNMQPPYQNYPWDAAGLYSRTRG